MGLALGHLGRFGDPAKATRPRRRGTNHPEILLLSADTQDSALHSCGLRTQMLTRSGHGWACGTVHRAGGTVSDSGRSFQKGTPHMYAVIKTGGKQYKVSPGDVIEVELLEGETVSFEPVLVADGDSVRATPAELSGATVEAKVIGESKGPKIEGFTYKNKSNNRRRWGHRQRYSRVEITSIS